MLKWDFAATVYWKDSYERCLPLLSPLSGLIRDLTRNVKTFVRQEFQLTRNEMTEKISRYGRDATSVAIGGAVA